MHTYGEVKAPRMSLGSSQVTSHPASLIKFIPKRVTLHHWSWEAPLNLAGSTELAQIRAEQTSTEVVFPPPKVRPSLKGFKFCVSPDNLTVYLVL